MGSLTDLATSVVNAATKFIPDPQRKLEYQLEVERMAHESEMAEVQAQASIVTTEAASKGFLASSWRPILMLVFGGLIVARWMGWSAHDLSPQEATELWEIVKLGLGGYVIGRSAEKIVPAVAAAVAKSTS